jgi:DNA-binding CsgD family transcriptional regulator
MLADSTVVFTRRQLQVVELIAQGRSNKEIAALLGISARTARAHCDILRAKLDAGRREIPHAYRSLTGLDPFAAAFPLEPAETPAC